jgi:hypothetical protein
MSQRHYGYQRYKLFCRASRGYGLYLKIANLKFIVFTLNQRVQGSSPCAPTNYLQFFPTLCHHHGMKRLLPVLMGFALLLLSSTEGWSLPPCPGSPLKYSHEESIAAFGKPPKSWINCSGDFTNGI